MTCFPVSTHVSISIYTLELEKKSSVAVTFMLFVNARPTFSPVKYPYCALFRLLLSILYPNIEECVGAVYTEKAAHSCDLVKRSLTLKSLGQFRYTRWSWKRRVP